MTRLTMTGAMVEAIDFFHEKKVRPSIHGVEDQDPSLEEPAIGKPISHVQVIAISKSLRYYLHHQSEGLSPSDDATIKYHLDDLLRGSKFYVDPPKPKIEHTSEYKALMERLRKEEEARAYERMINPPLPMESFAQRFPTSSHAKLFDDGRIPDAEKDDEITYADINRQMALIINIVVSIVACSVAIWMVSSHWSTGKRLALSMGGSGMVGVAEVVVYAGYLRRLKEARDKGKKEIEVKEIIKTWVIGGDDDSSKSKGSEPILLPDKLEKEVRRRNRQFKG